MDGLLPDSLPAGLFITPVILPPSAVEERNVKVLVHNGTSRDISIPAGTVITNVYPTDTLTTTSGDQSSTVIDSQLFDFGVSLLLEAWEKKLSTKRR